MAHTPKIMKIARKNALIVAAFSQVFLILFVVCYALTQTTLRTTTLPSLGDIAKLLDGSTLVMASFMLLANIMLSYVDAKKALQSYAPNLRFLAILLLVSYVWFLILEINFIHQYNICMQTGTHCPDNWQKWFAPPTLSLRTLVDRTVVEPASIAVPYAIYIETANRLSVFAWTLIRRMGVVRT